MIPNMALKHNLYLENLRFFFFWPSISMILAQLLFPLKFCFFVDSSKLVSIKF
jgi:hypothetical protein